MGSLWAGIRGLHQTLMARAVRYFRAREVIKVMAPLHASELAKTPVNQWVQKKAEQAKEIAAVKSGQFSIVDRRSWAFPYIPECYLTDCEILTKRGWISVSEMKKKDLFATRSSYGDFQWQRAKKIYKGWYEGEVFHFKNLGVDLRVTPNHRMVGRKVFREPDGLKRQQSLEFVRADELLNVASTKKWCRFDIPLRSEWKGRVPEHKKVVRIVADGRKNRYSHAKAYEVKLEDWCAFLGVYLAEGCATGAHDGIAKHDERVRTPIYIQAIAAAADKSWRYFKKIRGGGGANNPYRIRIAQEETSLSYKDIRELLLKKLPFAFSRDGNAWSCGSKALWQELAPLGNSHTKYIPQWVKELPPRYLRILFDWMMKGDGDRYGPDGQYWEYGTVSKRLADDLQEVIQKIGLSASVTRKDKEGKTELGRNIAPSYVVYVHTRSYAGVGSPEVLPYKGFVYCPSVPNGTVYVRRAGVGATNRGTGPAVWCGNSLHRL